MSKPLAGLLRLQERHIQAAKAEFGEQSMRIAAIDARRRAHEEHEQTQPSDEIAAIGLSSEAWRRRMRAERSQLALNHSDARAELERLRETLRERSAEKLAFERVAERIHAERERLHASRQQTEMDDLVGGRLKRGRDATDREKARRR